MSRNIGIWALIGFIVACCWVVIGIAVGPTYNLGHSTVVSSQRPPRSLVGEFRSAFTGLFSSMLSYMPWSASEQNSCGDSIVNRQVQATRRHQQAFLSGKRVTGLHPA
jgi:hypothetical protein